jgi:hypothetical protein
MALANSGNCFKCARPGHWADHCDLKPAASRAEHEKRIRDLGQRWAEKEITLSEKISAIKHENELWKDKTGANAK